MKRPLLAAATVTLIAGGLLLAAACGGSGKELSEVSVDASCDDFANPNIGPAITKEVELDLDNLLVASLCSNATTGFTWELESISGQGVLAHVDNKFVPPEQTEVVGAPGKEVWVFKALGKGTSAISMEYGQPWEGGAKDTWSIVFNATVK